MGICRITPYPWLYSMSTFYFPLIIILYGTFHVLSDTLQKCWSSKCRKRLAGDNISQIVFIFESFDNHRIDLHPWTSNKNIAFEKWRPWSQIWRASPDNTIPFPHQNRFLTLFFRWQGVCRRTEWIQVQHTAAWLCTGQFINFWWVSLNFQ